MAQKISAIVPTYNRASYICRAIDSIIEQSLQPDEIIVVDDGSTDGTSRLLRQRYKGRVQVIEQANEGVSSARRKELQVSSGEWIAFLDSDDEWLPGRLEAMAGAVEQLDESVVCLFGDTLVRRDNDEETRLFAEHSFGAPDKLEIFHNSLDTQFPFMFSLIGSSLLRRDALLNTKAFSEGFRSSEDFLVNFRLALHHKFAAQFQMWYPGSIVQKISWSLRWITVKSSVKTITERVCLGSARLGRSAEELGESTISMPPVASPRFD